MWTALLIMFLFLVFSSGEVIKIIRELKRENYL
jgi:hypothetical protein